MRLLYFEPHMAIGELTSGPNMGLFSFIAETILGFVFPGYILFAGAVKFITGDSSGKSIIASLVLGQAFPVVGDLFVEVFDGCSSSEQKEILNRKNGLGRCVKCGEEKWICIMQRDGQLLCNDCFKIISRNILLYSKVRIKCEYCGSFANEYYFTDGKRICVDCILQLNNRDNTIVVPSDEYLSFKKKKVSNNYEYKYDARYYKNY